MTNINETISDTMCAMQHAQWLYKSANILASRAGKNFILSTDSRFPSYDMPTIHSHLYDTFAYQLHQCYEIRTAAQDFTKPKDALNATAEVFRKVANELCTSFDLKIPAGQKKKTFNDDTIAPAIYDLADSLTSLQWYEHYPKGDYSRTFPPGYFYILNALHELALHLYAIKTLRLDTGLPAYERILHAFNPAYLAEGRHIRDILISDVMALKDAPNRVIRYDLEYPSTRICDQAIKEDGFVYVDYATGKITGDTSFIFGKVANRRAA